MCEEDGMEEWKECKLGDICNISSSKRIFAEEYVSSGIPFYRGKEIIEKHNKNTVSSELFITHERFAEIKSKFPVPQIDDILLTSVGTLGIPWLVNESNFYFKDGNLTWFRSNTEKVNPKFLYYWFESNYAKNQIDSMCIGSTQKALTIDTLSKFSINLPPLPTQQKIATILSSLDDKIELNNKINTNLEQQAQALFKNWFVDFEPFGGKMPEGWKIGKLGDFVDIKRGGSPRPIQKFLSDEGYRWLKISDVTSLSAPFVLNIAEHIKEEGLSKTVFLKAGSLVLSNSATPGIPKILDLDTCIHDGWLYFPKSQLSNEYLYLLFKEIRPQLLNLGNGSIFTNLKTDILKNFEISMPDEETLSKSQSIIKPMFEKMLETERETKQLETIRDTLLPKLMNGEIVI
jgi:type I restriction enzyme S subunit